MFFMRERDKYRAHSRTCSMQNLIIKEEILSFEIIHRTIIHGEYIQRYQLYNIRWFVSMKISKWPIMQFIFRNMYNIVI